ncbi:MAG: TRAP transporter substrate-binding protein [Betaproteobacteria bacterium]|jgi:TRAP-type mannitol/chloroaromatic compound transport system substrate-binding protein
MKVFARISLLCLALALPQAGHAQTPVRWKLLSSWAAGTVPQKVVEAFAERVRVMSAGRLVIEVLPAGSVVAPTESLDALQAGVIDAQQGGTAYFTTKDAAFSVLGDLQGAWDDPGQAQAWMEYGGGRELARELYRKYNAYFVTGVWYGVESVLSKKPVRSLADFRGMKIRAPVGMGQDIWKALGAAPVNLPGSEVYTALERGVVDASDWGTLSMNQDLGYHKLAKHPSFPGFHSMPMNDLAVNLKKWNALPDDLKAIVDAAGHELAREMMQRHAVDDLKVARDAKSLGFEPFNLSAEERRRFRDVAQKVWAQYAARSEMAKKIHESQIVFLRLVGQLP